MGVSGVLDKGFYSSSAEQVEKVANYNDYSFATGYHYQGGVRTFYLLRITADGTVDYKIQVGTLTSTVPTSSIIYELQSINETKVHISFTGVNSIGQYNSIVSIVNFGAPSTEKYVGFEGVSGSTVNKILALFESGSVYTIIGIRANYLFEYLYYSQSTSNTNVRYIQNGYSVYITDSLTIDMDVGRTKGIISFPYSTSTLTYPFTVNYGSTTSFSNYIIQSI